MNDLAKMMSSVLIRANVATAEQLAQLSDLEVAELFYDFTEYRGQ